MNCSTPGFLVLYCLLEFAQTHVYWVGDAFQPSHPLLPPSPPALNISQFHRLHRNHDFSINNTPNSCFKAFSLRATLMLLLQHSLSSSHQQKGAQDPWARGLHVFIPGHKLTWVKETDVYIRVNETEPQKQPGRPSTEWLTKVQDDHSMGYDMALSHRERDRCLMTGKDTHRYHLLIKKNCTR